MRTLTRDGLELFIQDSKTHEIIEHGMYWGLTSSELKEQIGHVVAFRESHESPDIIKGKVVSVEPSRYFARALVVEIEVNG